jgi:hypothetical protein
MPLRPDICQPVKAYRSDAAHICDSQMVCRHQVLFWLWEADAIGDGPLVNALCTFGRERWGPGLYW